MPCGALLGKASWIGLGGGRLRLPRQPTRATRRRFGWTLRRSLETRPLAWSGGASGALRHLARGLLGDGRRHARHSLDRKSTRLNSSHLVISYAVFCLKKKKK